MPSDPISAATVTAPVSSSTQNVVTEKEIEEKKKDMHYLQSLWDESTTAFEMLDKDKDGFLSVTDARYWLRCLGWCNSDKELDKIITINHSYNSSNSSNTGGPGSETVTEYNSSSSDLYSLKFTLQELQIIAEKDYNQRHESAVYFGPGLHTENDKETSDSDPVEASKADPEQSPHNNDCELSNARLENEGGPSDTSNSSHPDNTITNLIEPESELNDDQPPTPVKLKFQPSNADRKKLESLLSFISEGKKHIGRAHLKHLLTTCGEPIASEDFEELLDIVGFGINVNPSEWIDIQKLGENLSVKIGTPPCVPTQRSMFV